MKMNMKNSIQPIALVTGANSGIGKEIAQGLARAGVHVIMVCRDLERGEAALQAIKAESQSTSVDLLIADLSSQADIHSLSKKIHRHYPALHLLINNAGLVLPQKKWSVDGIEMTLATNHLGPFLLTHLLLDLLQKSAPARVINISSAIHQWGKVRCDDLSFDQRKYHCMKAYAQSKLLLNIVSAELAHRIEASGVTVNCVHPGAVRTALGSNHGNNSVLLKCIDRLIKFFFITPHQAAVKPLALALSPEFATITGQYFVKNKRTAPKAMSYDPVLTKEVWQISEKLVGLYTPRT